LSITTGAAPSALAADATGNWYVGAGIGQARASIPDSTVASELTGTGATAIGNSNDKTSVAGKVFLGYQFNKYVAAESGYFRLGDFSLDTTTTPAGTVHGDLKSRKGWNFDVVGTAPIVADKFLLLGRLGIQSSKTSDLFSGSGAAAPLANPAPSKNLVSYKYGVGAEFDFTKNVGVRGEWERYRVSDGFNGKMNVDAVTASVLYRF
jgi:OOP family OmpA-OmpF porin